MENKEIKINPILAPFQAKKWEILNDQFNFSESTTVKKSRGFWHEFSLRYFSSYLATIGFIALITIVLMAIFVPAFSQDPETTNIYNKYLSFNQKSHIFGTDKLGRDVWSRLWNGLNFSLGLSLAVTIIDLTVGVTLGLLMGKFEKFDKAMQNILKVFTNIPTFLIMVILVVVFGASFWTLTFSLTFTGWIGMSLQIRAQAKRVIVEEWNVASKVLGTPVRKQLYALVPHLIPMIITQLVFTIPGAILAETGLAFIGLSLPDTPTLGTMIFDGSEIITLYPRYTLIPSFVLIVMVTSIQFIGNSTQDALRRSR